jgi:hypothetical protein
MARTELEFVKISSSFAVLEISEAPELCSEKFLTNWARLLDKFIGALADVENS